MGDFGQGLGQAFLSLRDDTHCLQRSPSAERKPPRQICPERAVGAGNRYERPQNEYGVDERPDDARQSVAQNFAH